MYQYHRLQHFPWWLFTSLCRFLQDCGLVRLSGKLQNLQAKIKHLSKHFLLIVCFVTFPNVCVIFHELLFLCYFAILCLSHSSVSISLCVCSFPLFIYLKSFHRTCFFCFDMHTHTHVYIHICFMYQYILRLK